MHGVPPRGLEWTIKPPEADMRMALAKHASAGVDELFVVEDAQGRLVIQDRFTGAGLHRISTAGVSNGTYTVRAGSLVGRLVVKH